MRCDVIHGRDVSAALAASWTKLQAANPDLASPYFCPEFTRAVAEVRDDVRVAIVRSGEGPTAILPFQRKRLGRAAPVGGPLSDFQAVITASNDGWSAPEIVRAAGITCLDFDHVLCAQTPFAEHTTATWESPVMDVSAGYDTYVAQVRAGGSKVFKKLGTLRRKFEREIAPLRFEAESTDRGALETLLRWKSEQCTRTGTVDIFEVEWTRALLGRLLDMRSDGFSGVFSCLWAGDDLLAAHFGMRSATRLHYWFPSYNQEFSPFSPGLLLLSEIARFAAEHGVTTIDLGKGDAPYKERVQTGAVTIGGGSVELPSITVCARRVYQQTEDWVRRSPVAAPLRVPGRAIRRLERRLRFK